MLASQEEDCSRAPGGAAGPPACLAYAVLLHAFQLVEPLDLFVDGIDIAFDIAAQHDDVVGLHLELTQDCIYGVLQGLFQALVVGVGHGLKFGHPVGELALFAHIPTLNLHRVQLGVNEQRAGPFFCGGLERYTLVEALLNQALTDPDPA